MKINLRFYKESDDKWYADIAEQDGLTKEDMQMVSGADTLLDIIAQGEEEVWVTIYPYQLLIEGIQLRTTLTKINEDEFGATYKCSSIYGIDYAGLEVWLCPVTKWLFGEYPDVLRLSY